MIACIDRPGKHTERNKTARAMKIVAIEGLDKAGKHTALKVLRAYFKEKGLRVETMSFPNYRSPIGVLIHKWLKGEFLADEKTFELLQAADKQRAQVQIQEYERQGVDILLIDRYVHTEWAYGAFDNDDAWLQELTRFMRLPDAVLYLDVEPEVSMHRRGKYGDNDLYESDIERLRYTRDEYFCLFEEKGEAIGLEIIDANQPPLIAKSQLLKAAGRLYQTFTGNQPPNDDVLLSITDEEKELLKRYYGTDTPLYDVPH
ncbi:dTMP kinase [Metabacillus sp. SLBN-84]